MTALRRFRGDVAFAIPRLFDLLESEGWDYAIWIKGNSKLNERVDWLTKPRPGRPPLYQLPLPGEELVKGPPHSGEGRVPSR